jgi:FkbM family methyltransferase
MVTLSAVLRLLGRWWPEWVRVKTYNGWVGILTDGFNTTVRRQGVIVDLDLDGNLDRCLYLSGTYEDEYLNFLRNELRPGDTYIDIGGHIGLDAFIVGKSIGRGRIVCFEPSPDSAAKIRAGATANRLDMIEVVESGLANERGLIQLRADPAYKLGDSATRSRYNDGPVVVEAPLIRFDDWAAETGLDRMDVVKLDIEGSEYDALLGMETSLKTMRPRCLIVEVGNVRLEQAKTTATMIDDLLEGAGYERTGRVMLENVVYGLVETVRGSGPLK